MKNKALVEYIDPNETEHSLIAQNWKDWENNADKHARYTHMEIHHAFLFGIMCNQSIFAETNPAARISFSCSQSRQACSIYHSNFHVRMDKTAIVLNYGQTPLLKTRLLNHIDREEHPYGENVIVAIMCYTGYNVEDAILVNEGAIQRGLFNTTYYSVYSEHEERKKSGAGDNSTLVTDKRFSNIESEASVVGLKPGHDYSKLDRNGLIKENTEVDDKTIIIGLTSNSASKPGMRVDASKTTKKGQLGIVDKAFITEGEEGERIAKVRIREMRIPNLGDKMASRAGQKGVVGLVIPKKDMPFTKDGLKPDLIINPHALPTRKTIGHLVECLIGKVCTMYGGFSDCTAFNNEGSKAALYGRLLPEVGFHSSGHDIMYNGMTGEQIETEIFIGPNYYMRLKHMVKDKINYRALGPRTALTKQPVSGRANDGGLRIGEMERDSVIGHGINEFLRESMMERGDEYQMVVCNTTGALAVYNKARDLFMSPMADGPLRFFRSETGTGYALDTMTKYGRRFSVVSVPYSLKLLIQELAAINVQLRIITEDNLQQIESMAYSGHLNRLTLDPTMTPDKFVKKISAAISDGVAPLLTPANMNDEEVQEKRNRELEDRKRREEELLLQQIPATSPAYVPSPGPLEEYPETQFVTQEDYERDSVEFPEYYERAVLEDGTIQMRPKYEYPGDLGYYFLNLPKKDRIELLAKPREEQIEYLEQVRLVKTKLNRPAETYSSPNTDASVSTSEEMSGGAAYSVDDFELGENVYYRGSVDLGLPYNQAWSVVKKGGRLLTLKAVDVGFRGGGLTNSDLVQIVGPSDAVKPAEFERWETQRAGMRQLAQQQQMELFSGGGGGAFGSVGGGSQQPQGMTFAPVIKVVGGNDYSKNEPDTTGGSNDAFSSLVIPSQNNTGLNQNGLNQNGLNQNGPSQNGLNQTGPIQKGGGEGSENRKSGQTIMGGLKDFGQLVINKIM